MLYGFCEKSWTLPGIEAHIEQLEEDLLHKREWLVAIHLSGTDKFTVEEIAECIVDIDLLKEHLGKLWC